MFFPSIVYAGTFIIETDNIESVREYFKKIKPENYILENPTSTHHKFCEIEFNSKAIFYIRRKDQIFGTVKCMNNKILTIEQINEICKFLGKDWKLLTIENRKIICEQKRNF